MLLEAPSSHHSPRTPSQLVVSSFTTRLILYERPSHPSILMWSSTMTMDHDTTAHARVRRRERLVQEDVIHLDGKTLNQRTMQHRLNAANKARQKQSQWEADHPSSTQWWNKDNTNTTTTAVMDHLPDLNATSTPIQHASDVDQLWSRRIQEANVQNTISHSGEKPSHAVDILNDLHRTNNNTNKSNNDDDDDTTDVELTYLDKTKMVVNQGDLYSPPPMVRRSSYEPPNFGQEEDKEETVKDHDAPKQNARDPPTTTAHHHRSASEPLGTRESHEVYAKRPQERPIVLPYRSCSPEDYLNGQQWICFTNNTYSPPEIPPYQQHHGRASSPPQDDASFPILGKSARGNYFFTASDWECWNQTANTDDPSQTKTMMMDCDNNDANENNMAPLISQQETRSESASSNASSNLSMSDLIRYKNLEPELDVFADYSSSDDDDEEDSEDFPYMRTSFQESTSSTRDDPEKDVAMMQAATAKVIEETNQAFWDPATYQPLVDDEEESELQDSTSRSDSVQTPPRSNKESSRLYSVPRKEWYADSSGQKAHHKKTPSSHDEFGLFRVPSKSDYPPAQDMPGQHAKTAFTLAADSERASACPSSTETFASVARAVSPLSSSSAGSMLLRQASLDHKSLSEKEKALPQPKRSTLSMGPSTKSAVDAKKPKSHMRISSGASFSSVKELIGLWEQGKKDETPVSPGSVKDMIQKWESASVHSTRGNMSMSQEMVDIEAAPVVSQSFDEGFESQEVELQETNSTASTKGDEPSSKFAVNVYNTNSNDTDRNDDSTNEESNFCTDQCIRPYPKEEISETEVPVEIVCSPDDDRDDGVKEIKTDEREAVLSLLRKAYMSIRTEKTLSVKKKRQAGGLSMDEVSEISDSENQADSPKRTNEEKRVAMNILCEPSAGAVEVLLHLPELSTSSEEASDDSIVVVSLPDKVVNDSSIMGMTRAGKKESSTGSVTSSESSKRSSSPRVTIGNKKTPEDKPFDEGEDEDEPVWIEVEEQGPHDEM